MVIYHIDMIILGYRCGIWANDMRDDSIDTVISHIDMGHLVTLCPADPTFSRHSWRTWLAPRSLCAARHASRAAFTKRRKLKLKAKFESGSSYSSSKR